MPRKKAKKVPLTRKQHHENEKHVKMLTDMSYFYRHTDWSGLWDKFYRTVDERGAWKYDRLWDFCKAVAESQRQRDFLFWYLGPADKDWANTEEGKRWPFITPTGPVDWVHRRNTGGWDSPEIIKKFSRDLARRAQALETLQETATWAGYYIERAIEMDKRLEKEFRGTFFVEGLDFAANIARAREYLNLKERIQNYFGVAHERYARALGINLDDVGGLVKLIESAALAAQQDMAAGKEVTPQQRAITSVVEMTLAKFGKHQIPLLPPDAEQKIVDAVAEPETPPKKKAVQ